MNPEICKLVQELTLQECHARLAGMHDWHVTYNHNISWGTEEGTDQAWELIEEIEEAGSFIRATLPPGSQYLPPDTPPEP